MKVSETISFRFDLETKGWLESFKSELDSLSTDKTNFLRGSTVILNEHQGENDEHRLQDFHGVSIALDEMRKSPERLIILCGFAPLSLVRKMKPEIDVVLKQKSTVYCKFPYTAESFLDAVKKVSQEGKEVEAKATLVYVQSQVATILHRLKLSDPKNPVGQHEVDMVKVTVMEAKKAFPSVDGFTDAEVLDFLFIANEKREEVCKGEFISGVYCDVEGTVLVGEMLNQDILSMLNKYTEEGKQVTLWTDGDIAKLQNILNDNGVNYSLKRKIDYAGAIVEIAIDDMDEFSFTARTKICAKQFIRAIRP